MKALGVDYGLSRIGLAVSDESARVACPIGVVTPRTRDPREVAALLGNIARERGVALIVIGFPRNMDGTPGSLGGEIVELARALESEGFPVELWDERLSTVEAERALIEGNLSRQKRRRVIDKVAACLILQGYLDRLERPSSRDD
ncbi:MAG TPA: Holliday junction resolvase RuvX [Firmicutes bacterium]|nr:Holliday junction resolvase RuvX [Bacillota bacterium]